MFTILFVPLHAVWHKNNRVKISRILQRPKNKPGFSGFYKWHVCLVGECALCLKEVRAAGRRRSKFGLVVVGIKRREEKGSLERRKK